MITVDCDEDLLLMFFPVSLCVPLRMSAVGWGVVSIDKDLHKSRC